MTYKCCFVASAQLDIVSTVCRFTHHHVTLCFCLVGLLSSDWPVSSAVRDLSSQLSIRLILTLTSCFVCLELNSYNSLLLPSVPYEPRPPPAARLGGWTLCMLAATFSVQHIERWRSDAEPSCCDVVWRSPVTCAL